jgi:photosystem II stability/assembly factor-like uncharacterized protein
MREVVRTILHNLASLLFVMVFLSSASLSQWIREMSGTTPDVQSPDLNSVRAANAQTAWAVGADGTILKTSNGGKRWLSQNSGTSSHLLGVFSIDTARTVAVGAAGQIRKTTDGGSTWLAKDSQVTDSLNSVFFAMPFVGWIVGNHGCVLTTTDAGEHWQSQSSGTATDLVSVCFIDSATGWICGRDFIGKTTNSGSSWIQLPETTLAFTSVTFVNASKGWATLNDIDWGTGRNMYIARSTDGGNSWLTRSDIVGSFYGVSFVDENRGWFVGGESFTGAVIMGTTNQGGIWSNEPIASNGSANWPLRSVHALSAEIGWAVGSHGLIVKQDTARSIELEYPNGGNKLAIGLWTYPSWFQNRVQTIRAEYSTDGGTTWSVVRDSCAAAGSNFEWHIPNTPSSHCRFKVSDFYDPDVYDISDEEFAIGPPDPEITLTFPSGGQSLQVGHVYGIRWNTRSSDSLRIEYTTTNGNQWVVLESSYPSSAGSLPWLVPNSPSRQCLVKISDLANPAFSSTSAAPFRIDTVAHGYFPLAVGNSWTIKAMSPAGESWSVKRVVGDTLMDDGQRYSAILNSTWNSGGAWTPAAWEYYRQQGSRVYRYPGNVVIDFGWTLDSGATSFVVGDGLEDWFGRPLRTLVMSPNGGYDYYSFVDSIGFGVIGATLYHDYFHTQIVGCVVDGKSYGSVLGAEENDSEGIPGTLSLYQNYPNPFNPLTTIRYGLPRKELISLAVYNILGQQVALLVHGEEEAGYHEVRFDANRLASGVYLYRLKARPTDGGQAGWYVETKKLLIVR